MQKRGQAATEFLMTYGWALVGILIVFSLLYYYFSFGGPNTCNVDQPFTCIDLKGDSTNNKITLVLSSSGVEDIIAPPSPTISALTIMSETFTCTPEATANTKLKDADLYQQNIVFDCNPKVLNEGDSYTGEFSITYSKSGGLPHTASGNFYVNVE